MKVRQEIGKARPGLTESCVHCVKIPTRLGKTDWHRLATVARDRAQGIVVGRVIDRDAVARPRQRTQDEREAILRAARHDDLLRRSEEHTSELQSLMRISYAVFCLNKKRQT